MHFVTIILGNTPKEQTYAKVQVRFKGRSLHKMTGLIIFYHLESLSLH